MRIAMIGQKGMPAKFGGVERHVHELSVRLVDIGHKVTVYSRKWYTKGRDGKIVPQVSMKISQAQALLGDLFGEKIATKAFVKAMEDFGISKDVMADMAKTIKPGLRLPA